jgi:hypothetical protein
MRNFIRNFRRDGQAWLCLSPCELILPRGTIRVTPGSRFAHGTSFMGVDLAKLLDEQLRLDDKAA